MAHERLGERIRHRVRRLGGLAGLALVGLLLSTACNESVPVDPGQLPSGGSNTGSTGGGGGDSTSLGDPNLVGSWINVRTPDTGDVTRISTTWNFAADGTCGRAILTESASAGSSSVLKLGNYIAASNTIAVRFTGDASGFTMTYGFPTVATLTLDSLTYVLASTP